MACIIQDFDEYLDSGVSSSEDENPDFSFEYCCLDNESTAAFPTGGTGNKYLDPDFSSASTNDSRFGWLPNYDLKKFVALPR